MIALGVLTDGRFDYLHETLRSASEHLPEVTYRYIVDDTGTGESGSYLKEHYPTWAVIHHDTRRGLAGAVQSSWEHALDLDVEYLFHLEDDFTFTRTVQLAKMAKVLDGYPACAQMLLKRQPLSPEELAAGDVLAAMDPRNSFGRWTSHFRIFSLNPCLIPRKVLERGWPEGNEAEMTSNLLNAGFYFGVWGSVSDPPAVTHIGQRRSPGWQL